MSSIISDKVPQQAPLSPHTATYEEIIQYLEKNWKESNQNTVKTINQEVGNIAQQFKSIIIAGTHGKNITMHYLRAILQKNHLNIGSLSSSHLTSYNEHIKINNITISNHDFTTLAGQIFSISRKHALPLSSLDLLTMIALLYFHSKSVDVILLETSNLPTFDPVTICTPSILAIPKITTQNSLTLSEEIHHIISHLSPSSSVISADPSKISLTIMEKRTKSIGASWIMPIRKVAPLSYPFEQLFGRPAALAYRTAMTFLQKHVTATEDGNMHTFTSPEFWQSIENEIPSTFQITSLQSKSIILDKSKNLDALKNLFLGIRLLSYQRPTGKFFFIIDTSQTSIEADTFSKMFKSYFKKIAGGVAFCPIIGTAEEIGNHADNNGLYKQALKSAKIKTFETSTFAQAFNLCVDEMNNVHDLLIITGSQSILKEFTKTTQLNLVS